MYIRPRRDAPLDDMSALRPSTGVASNNSQDNPPTIGFLPVFTLFPEDSVGIVKSSKDPLVGLKEQLEAADTWLTQKTTSSVKQAYEECKDATRNDAYTYLLEIQANVERIDSEPARRRYQERISLFNLADVLFCTFFPTEFVGPVANKFWGAILTVISVSIILRACVRFLTAYNSRLGTSMIRTMSAMKIRSWWR